MQAAVEAPPDCGVVIVAGGSGSRVGGEPKQFRTMSGKPLLQWSLEFFASQSSTVEIVVVVPAAYLANGEEICVTACSPVPVSCVAGGRCRQDSVYAGLRQLSHRSNLVAVHDGARPFPPTNFEEVVAEARRIGGAIYAIPVTDSLKTSEQHLVARSVPRENLWSAQTPQVFRTDWLKTGLEKCSQEGVEVTDDAAAVEQLGYPVVLVEGARTNIKVTLPADFLIAEAIASSFVRGEA